MSKKLQLNKETLRHLTDASLHEVTGGNAVIAGANHAPPPTVGWYCPPSVLRPGYQVNVCTTDVFPLCV